MEKKQPAGKALDGFSVVLPSTAPLPSPKAAAQENAATPPPESMQKVKPTFGSKREKSKQLVAYVHPEFQHALRVYVAESQTTINDWVVEALEAHAKKKGLVAKIRV